MTEGNPRLVLARGEQACLPPALIIQGTADDNVTPDMASSFAAAYRAAGGEAHLAEYVDEVHGFIRQDLDAPAAVAALHAMRDFATRQSRQAGLVSTS
jgi:dipeptidyl aminopeptidase/acylaminoacyl peptidase